jgi:hypothetical protein
MSEFESCVMPEYIEQLWGPVNLPRLPDGMDNDCDDITKSGINIKFLNVMNILQPFVFLVRLFQLQQIDSNS